MARIKRLVLQVAGNLDSSKKHYRERDTLIAMVRRDYVNLSPTEDEAVCAYIQHLTGF